MLSLLPDRGLALEPVGGRGRASRFVAQDDGTWLGLDGYYAGETLKVAPPTTSTSTPSSSPATPTTPPPRCRAAPATGSPEEAQAVNAGVAGQAAALFAVTNIDDILILALFFAQAAGRPGAAARIVAGQYLGFAAILAVAVAAGFGASFLPGPVIPYLGLLPLAIGLKAGWQAWKNRSEGQEQEPPGGPGALAVAAVTFANGGDNIGVYVPVFATSGPGGMTVYVTVFLLLVAVWCAAGRFFATRPVIAGALTRWGHILLPAVLIAIGAFILIDGGAFGL
ncbi:hypothetical protein GCM10020001_106230 [Nonomuraea salmonea]